MREPELTGGDVAVTTTTMVVAQFRGGSRSQKPAEPTTFILEATSNPAAVALLDPSPEAAARGR
jgi:hypothetical protein